MTPLRQRMSEDMQVRNLSLNTQLSYLQQVSLFARHFGKSPDLLGREDIRTYQVYLANEKKLMPGSIHIAISALRFFFNVTLERAWGSIATSQEAQKLPTASPEDTLSQIANAPIDLPPVDGIPVGLSLGSVCRRFPHLTSPSVNNRHIVFARFTRPTSAAFRLGHRPI
ncbi:hypothetical protein GFPCMMHI_05753 [Ensifer adhaerens]|nr:hypothetical protein [Ensifer adhaerens]